MLRTPKKDIELNVSSCRLINDGDPLLRITCETVLLTPEQRKIIQQSKDWYLDGAGGPIKVKNAPQFLQRHHMPGTRRGVRINTAPDVQMLDESAFDTGAGHFTIDLVIDLFLPRGNIDIHFTRYNDEMEMIRRAKEQEAAEERAIQEQMRLDAEKAKKKSEQQNAVDGFRRKFRNLDLDSDE